MDQWIEAGRKVVSDGKSQQGKSSALIQLEP